jgi:hypothetical protein
MGLPNEPFFKVLVESFDSGNVSGHHGRLHIRPVAGQGLDSSLYVESPRAMRKEHPVGTQFFVTAKLSNKEGGVSFLKCPHQWGYSVATPDATRAFLSNLKASQAK